MNAIIYCRFSPRPKNKEGEKCESNETQEELCREYCERRGIEVKAVFGDEYKSGSDPDRPGLWDAIEALGNGDILVCYNRDRLARDVYLAECINRSVQKAGAEIEAVQGDISGPESPETKMIRQVLAALSEYQRKLIAVRTKHAMLRHQRQGRIMSKRLPYGWKQDPRNKKRMVRDESEQSVLADMQIMKDAGMSYKAISENLNSLEVPSKEGLIGRWTHRQVGRVLQRIQQNNQG